MSSPSPRLTDVQLRPAASDDIGAIQAIYAHHVSTGCASFETDPPSLDEMQRRFEAIQTQGYPYWVAVQQQQVCGYAYANAFRTRPAYRFTVEDSIYLAPEYSGKGIGQRLLTRLIEDCTERGFRQMLAVIGDSNNTASITLHRRCGFTNMAVFRATGWKFNRWVDTVLMQRALGDGDSSAPQTNAA